MHEEILAPRQLCSNGQKAYADGKYLNLGQQRRHDLGAVASSILAQSFSRSGRVFLDGRRQGTLYPTIFYTDVIMLFFCLLFL